jgi:hypothetical protein
MSKINLPPWVNTVLRDVFIALLISLLTVMGYDVKVAQPTFAKIAVVEEHNYRAIAALGKTTNFYALQLDDDLVVGGSALVGEDLRLAPSTAISLTANGVLTPTAALQPIESAAPVTVTIATGGAAAGDLLYLYNRGSNTIAITDTGTAKLDGNGSLAASGTMLLVYDGTNWLELARTNP